MRFNIRSVIAALVAIMLVALTSYADRDISTTTGVKSGLGTAVYNADTTGSAVDVSNYGSAMIVIATASGTYDESNSFKFQLLHGDTAAGTFAEVESGDVIGATPDASGTIHTIDAAQGTPAVAKVGYVAEKRFLKIRLDETGTATTTASVVVIGGRPRISPVSD